MKEQNRPEGHGEQEIIAHFLERSGQYVTNDASRGAAVAEAVQAALALRDAKP